uniref:Putative membrane protein n=1 Tax=Rhipicephalus microplus TaxID=6941 RepID=A0A6G4ZW23_RHIMP
MATRLLKERFSYEYLSGVPKKKLYRDLLRKKRTTRQIQHSEHRYIMVLKTSIAAVAMSTLLLLALSSSADASGCEPPACYHKCVNRGATTGNCIRGVCQCRGHQKRSIEGHVAEN